MNEVLYQSFEPSIFMSLFYLLEFFIHFLFVLPILIMEQNLNKLKIFVFVLVLNLFLEFH